MTSEDFARLVKSMSEDVRQLNVNEIELARARPAASHLARLVPLSGQEGQNGAGVSKLATRFEQEWEQCHGPVLVREYRFHPRRMWRADYAHPESRTLIELEGGVYMQGRHTRPAGYIEDARKYNAAVALGWRVFRLPTGYTHEDLFLVLDTILGKPYPMKEDDE